jgi:hypothetical protein
MRLMTQSLLANGRKGASLWVIRENIGARCFYETLGGALIGEKVDQVSGTTIVEVAYVWSDLGSFVR